MHYRNGREAKNGDPVVQLSTTGGRVTASGTLIAATPGNDYCNGTIVFGGGSAGPVTGGTGACLCDCLHADDLAAILAEKGLDKRPVGK